MDEAGCGMEDSALSRNAREIVSIAQRNDISPKRRRRSLTNQSNLCNRISIPTRRRENCMKTLLFVIVLLSGSLLFAQNSTAANNDQSAAQNVPDSHGKVMVVGCVSMFSGDYTLVKDNPGITYELQGNGKIKLHNYLGRRVQVIGRQQESLSTSSDAIDREGSPSPLTIKISSIKTLDKDCSQKPISR